MDSLKQEWVNIVWGVALLYYFVVSNFDFTLFHLETISKSTFI